MKSINNSPLTNSLPHIKKEFLAEPSLTTLEAQSSTKDAWWREPMWWSP
jgi:hypothetical protein